MENIKEFLSNGDGNGYGNGDGYGNSYGNGYGDGNGRGDGYGNGIKSFNGQTVYFVDSINTIITSVYGNAAKGFILQNDMQLIPCYIAKGNGMFAHGETLKSAVESLQNKIYEEMDADEAIDLFLQEFPDKRKKYPVKDLYIWHNRLTGSCEMGRKQFAKKHDIDIDNDSMTVTEFIQLTENSYGGSIISQIKERIR